MSWYVYLVIGVVVALIIVGAVAAAIRRRTERLRSTFGPEYDRTVAAAGGDQLRAERELSGRVQRRKQLRILDLSDAARDEYRARWQQIQTAFVDQPAQSVRDADALIGRVMSDRGYPAEDFDQRAADLSVDQANVVDGYRSAHNILTSSGDGNVPTEDLRRAMTQFRDLFDALVGSAAPAGDSAGVQGAPAAQRPGAALR
jgi:hypothetical protein